MNDSTDEKLIRRSTLDHVPGRQIKSSLGIVVGTGSGAFGGSSSSNASRAYTAAMAEIMETSRRWGADAVIGLKVTATSAGSIPFVRTQTVIITGTAVTLV